MTLLRPENLQRLKALLGNRPMLVGLSRKRFLSALITDDPSKHGNGKFNTLRESAIFNQNIVLSA